MHGVAEVDRDENVLEGRHNDRLRGGSSERRARTTANQQLLRRGTRGTFGQSLVNDKDAAVGEIRHLSRRCSQNSVPPVVSVAPDHDHVSPDGVGRREDPRQGCSDSSIRSSQ